MRPFRRLTIWVEGPDDQRFVDAILRPEFERNYDWVEIVNYAVMTKQKITKFIESLRAMPDTTYVFLADNDDSPCVTRRKQVLMNDIKSLEADRISVVVKEIESWYLAGLTADGLIHLEINEPGNTENLSKEEFDLLRPQRFESRIDWMIEIATRYSLADGISRNSSLRHFVRTFLPDFLQPI